MCLFVTGPGLGPSIANSHGSQLGIAVEIRANATPTSTRPPGGSASHAAAVATTHLTSRFTAFYLEQPYMRSMMRG